MSNVITATEYCFSVFDGTHDSPKQSQIGYPLITSKHLSNNSLDIKNAYLISEFDYKDINKRSKVSQWDILFSMIGTVGEVYLEKNNDVCYAIKNIGVFSCKDEDRAKWLYYYLKSPIAKKHIKRYLNGAVQKFLPLSALREFPVLDFNQNSKLLTRLISFLDEKIIINNRINAELEAMAKTLYDYWFVQFDFPNEEGKPYKSSGGKMVYNTTLKREIPVMFSEGVLDNLGQIVGGSTPDTKDCDNFCIKGVPWITPNDLSNNQGNKYILKGEKNVSDKGIKSASLKKYPLGTVLLTSRAPIGYMAIARKEFTTNQGFKSFIPNKGYPTDFVYFTIKNSLSIIIQFASGSTFKEISTTVLKTVPIVLPPLHIVKDFTNKIYSLTKKQNILEQECSELRNLRDWLLPMLMNGQVTVK